MDSASPPCPCVWGFCPCWLQDASGMAEEHSHGRHSASWNGTGKIPLRVMLSSWCRFQADIGEILGAENWGRDLGRPEAHEMCQDSWKHCFVFLEHVENKPGCSTPSLSGEESSRTKSVVGISLQQHFHPSQPRAVGVSHGHAWGDSSQGMWVSQSWALCFVPCSPTHPLS